MAKANTILVKLVSTAETGFYYVTKKNTRTSTEKLEFRKYDPVVRKHVMFKESQDKIAPRRAVQFRNLATVSRNLGTEMGFEI